MEGGGARSEASVQIETQQQPQQDDDQIQQQEYELDRHGHQQQQQQRRQRRNSVRSQRSKGRLLRDAGLIAGDQDVDLLPIHRILSGEDEEAKGGDERKTSARAKEAKNMFVHSFWGQGQFEGMFCLLVRPQACALFGVAFDSSGSCSSYSR